MRRKIRAKRVEFLKSLLDQDKNESYLQVHREATVVDMHMHPAMKRLLFGKNPGLRSGTTHGVNLSQVQSNFSMLLHGGYDIVGSMAHAPEPGLIGDFKLISVLRRFVSKKTWKRIFGDPPFNRTLAVMDSMEQAVAESNARLAKGDNSAVRARFIKRQSEFDSFLGEPKDKRGIAFIHAVEGGHSLDDGTATEAQVLKNLQELHDRGVAYLTLAHFYPNLLAHPCYPYTEEIVKLTANPDVWTDVSKGLTALGKTVVRKMLEIGMLIDITHSSPQSRRDIFEEIRKYEKENPGAKTTLMASHIGSHNLNPTPYNLTDSEIRFVAERGGIVGVIFMNYWLVPYDRGQGIDFIARTIGEIVRAAGDNYDCVGLGSDFDGFADPPDDLYNPIMLSRLTQRLLAEGHDKDQVKKIMGGNALRVLRQGLKR